MSTQPMTRVLFPLAGPLLAGAAAAQGTWVVDASGGPGTHFTDLPPALAAAADGEIPEAHHPIEAHIRFRRRIASTRLPADGPSDGAVSASRRAS